MNHAVGWRKNGQEEKGPGTMGSLVYSWALYPNNRALTCATRS